MTARRHAVFRADASSAIGTGHVVRCLTLAAELIRRGWIATLATRELPPALAPLARETAVGLVELPATLPSEDESRSIGATLSRRADLAVVDHYGIGAGWQRVAAGWAERQLAIDDLADRSQAVDIVLNQNLPIDPSRYQGLVDPSTTILSGPAYALVRPGFAAAREQSLGRRAAGGGRLERILVFMSGTDPHDVAGRAVRAAARVTAGSDVAIEVVVGGGYPHLPDLRAWAATQPLVDVHVDTQAMAALMERADLAIGASGSASWERCTLGLPSVLLTLADNQIEGARALADAGAAVDLGPYSRLEDADLEMTLTELRADPARLASMSRAAARITDGLGTMRVADAVGRLFGEPS